MLRMRQSRGMTLIEGLVAMLLFAIGILALVGMYSASVRASSDAQYRVEASDLATQVIQDINSSVNRTPGGGGAPPVVDPVDLASFAYNTGGGNCGFNGGGAGGKQAIANWIAKVTAPGTGLPSTNAAATAGYQQILVSPGPAFNQVTVTLCWQGPNDPTPHSQIVIGYVN